MADLKRVNGNAISWGSITFKLDGDRYTGFTDVSYGDSRERAKIWGMGRHQAPRARSRGKYDADNLKIKGPKSSVAAFCAALAAKAADQTSFGNTEFTGVLQFSEADEPAETVTFERCVVVKRSSAHTENNEVLQEELEISVMLIRYSEGTLFDETIDVP